MIYDLADLKVEINNKLPFTEKFCEEYLSKDQNVKADISVKVTNEEFYAEKAQSSEYSDGYIENICIYRSICLEMPLFDRFLMHSSVLEYNGNGYCFCGRSGAGKSTHSKLWLENLPQAKIVNGDKPIIRFDGKDFYAYGTPWMGKERFGTKSSAKIKAICFIVQSKTNEIRELSLSEKTDCIFSQLLIPTTELSAVKTLELANELVNRIPVYELKCDISKEAFKTSFEKMSGEVFNG